MSKTMVAKTQRKMLFRSILKKSIDDLHHHRDAMMVADNSMPLRLMEKTFCKSC